MPPEGVGAFFATLFDFSVLPDMELIPIVDILHTELETMKGKSMANKNDADFAGILKLERALTLARSQLKESIPAQILQTFLVVARNEGSSVKQIADLIGASPTTASRHLSDLGAKLRDKTPGYGLIERREDPEDLRSIFYLVTPRGRLFLKQLIDIME
jgi:DNA-binding MarR family transcriptional regulator